MEITTRDDARMYFRDSGLSYQDIHSEDINSLVSILAKEFKDFLSYGGEHARNLQLAVRKPRVKDVKSLKNGLVFAYIKVKASNFESREGISFNENGFIGFGGELDSETAQPILRAFIKWCDEVSSKRNENTCINLIDYFTIFSLLERSVQTTGELTEAEKELATKIYLSMGKSQREIYPISYPLVFERLDIKVI